MDNTNLSNKVCLITGANSGIGKATAKKLATLGAYIIMVCRNEDRAESAKQEIIKDSGHQGVEIMLADLALQHDVREVAAQCTGQFDQLDLLINNAGMIPSERQETPEGIEKTLAVNHLAPFLLTNLLMDLLNGAPAARVINVSSETHRSAAGSFEIDNLQLQDGYSPMKAYSLSKLCNIMFTHELAKRTANTNITTNALHPGTVRTNLTSEASWLWYLLFMIGKPFMRSPSSGAETPVYLATSDDVNDVSGKYFKNNRPVAPADIAFDDNRTEQLWKKSEELTGLE